MGGGISRATTIRRVDPARVVAALALASLLAGCATAVDPMAIADAQTAARIKTALVNDPEVGEFAIEVRVVRGVASLTGRVPSQAHADRATALARSVSGVTDVRTLLQIGGDPSAAVLPERGGLPEVDSAEFTSNLGLLAVGANVGWSIPREENLKTRMAIGPLIKIGSPSGLGPTIGFDWFQAEVQSIGSSAILTKVRVRPVMVGLGYTWVSDRLSVAPSVVAGYAFNSLRVTDTGLAQGLPVEVDNSFVWRVGASAWYDTSRRTAINVSIGHVMTGLRLTVLDRGRLERRDASGDTTIVHAGIAYRLF